MGSVKAEWHLADLADSDDPFGSVVYSTGLEIDLNGSEGELATAVVQLLKIEGNMASAGLTCTLKDDGQDCLSCPMATLDAAEPRSVLCRLGKDQCTIEQLCAERTRERTEPVQELADIADSAMEMGHLPDDLAELLTSVGL